MDSTSINYWLIVALGAMLFSGFFSGMEIAFVSSNKVRAEIDAKKGGLVSRTIHMFYRRREMFISTMLIGNNIVNVVYSMAMAALLTTPFANVMGNEFATLLMVTVVSTFIILLMGEFIPKTIFRINPNYSLRMFSLPLCVCYMALYPISLFTEWLSKRILRLMGVTIDKNTVNTITVDELDAYVQENIDKHEDENQEVEREVKIFENALDFSDTRLRDCMIPRNEIVGVDIACTTRQELVDLFGKTGLSKLVVYHDNIDSVIGFIQVSELFRPEVNWKDQVKPVLFAPETMLAKKMMQNLLKERRSMAIVLDEFGGTSGLVTLEDLVEEIFGDIKDEHDSTSIVDRRINDSTYEFSGRMEIAQINDQYHLDLPESDDYQTIAGLLLNRMEAIPNEGDTVQVGKLTLTVLKKSAARVELVRLTAQPNETTQQG